MYTEGMEDRRIPDSVSNIIQQKKMIEEDNRRDGKRTFNIIRSLKYFYDHTWYFKESLK
jgi:hypothetical protein